MFKKWLVGGSLKSIWGPNLSSACYFGNCNWVGFRQVFCKARISISFWIFCGDHQKPNIRWMSDTNVPNLHRTDDRSQICTEKREPNQVKIWQDYHNYTLDIVTLALVLCSVSVLTLFCWNLEFSMKDRLNQLTFPLNANDIEMCHPLNCHVILLNLPHLRRGRDEV